MSELRCPNESREYRDARDLPIAIITTPGIICA
jgi:hypothetical protein